MRSDTDATRVADCFILDFPCLCEASGQPMTLLGARRRLRQTSIGTPLVAAVNPGPAGLRLGGDWRKKLAESENDREPDQPRWRTAGGEFS